MKRTISHEASAAAAHLREMGIAQGHFFGGGALDPLTVLGLGPQARWPEVRQAYISRLRVYHPERHPQDFMRVCEAYDMLKRFFRAAVPGAANDAADASIDGGETCSNGPNKRRRADAAGASVPSLGSAGVWNMQCGDACHGITPEAAPIIALEAAGVGHIGHRESFPLGNGLATAVAMHGEDAGGLARASSNHMSGGCFGGMQAAPMNAFGGAQTMGSMCGGFASLSGGQYGSDMMIG